MQTTWDEGLPGWNDLVTVVAYESFNERHPRYVEANRVLARHAALAPGIRVLDFAAGTGLTAEAALTYLGERDRILCVEPARAMRDRGRQRLRGAPIDWTDRLPHEHGTFDRVLCGAAIWQLEPFDDALGQLVDLLAAGGALCFNIPAAYLGEPDEPGGGRDPYLVELPSLLASETAPPAAEPVALRSGDEINDLLTRQGLTVREWSMRSRLTQAAYRDWLKIPVIGNGLLSHVNPFERAAAIDRAYEKVDADSWRWESWRGWTAWRPA